MHWIILITLTLARVAMGFQFQSIAALAPQITLQTGLGFAAIGALVGIYLLPGAVAALLGGWAGQRWGDIRTALTGLALMALGGAAGALVAGFEAQMAARLVAGLGAVALNVMLSKMAGDWFQGHPDLPVGMGILVSSWPAGLALAMLLLPLLSTALSLTALLMLPAALSLVALIQLALVWRAPVAATPSAATKDAPRLLPSEWLLITLAGLIWGLYNVAFIATITWGAARLAERAADPASAAATGSLIGWAAIFSVAAGGVIARLLPRPDSAALGCFALSCAGLAWFALGGTWIGHPVILLGMGLLIGPAAAMIMTLPIEAARAELRALAMGLYWAIYYALMGLAPLAFGTLREATGEATAPLVLASGLMVACALLWLVFRATQRRLHPVSA